jgi:predicted MFS family arabinose efflux permease
VQGAAAAVAAPAALSLIAVTFPEGPARTRALGVYAAMTGMGGAVGVIAGGLLTTYASWRWVFFVNVPLGMVLATVAPLVIPESGRHPRRWDIQGALLGTSGFALLVYGLTRAATGPDGISHLTDAATLWSLAGALVALVGFVVVEALSPQPLLPLWIFRDRDRAGVYLMLVCLASVFFAMFFFLTLFMQTVWGYSALRGGLAYLPFVAMFIVTAGICSKAVARIGARVPITAGAVVAPGALYWLSRVHETSPYLTGVCAPLVLFAVAAGCIFVPLTMVVVAGISDEHAGVASSMFNAGQQVGGALGLAVIGSVAWTATNSHARALAHLVGSHAPALHPGLALYRAALGHGVMTALELGAVAAVTALVVAAVTIRVRREHLPAGPVVA